MKSTIIILFFVPFFCFSQEEDQIYWDSLKFHYNTDPYKSIYYLDKLIKLNPRITDYLLHKGAVLHDLGKYREAISEFSKALIINPNIVDAYVRRGISHLALHQYDSGLYDFNRGVGKYRHQDSVIYRYKALAYVMKGNFEAGKINYDSALKYCPDDKEMLNNRAIAKTELKDLKGALSDINLALHIDKNYLNGIKTRAITYFQLEIYDKSLTDCLEYLKRDANDEIINYYTGCLYFKKKNYNDAITYLKKSKEKLKTKEVYLTLGMANYFLANDQEAIDDLSIVLTKNPTIAEERDVYYIIGVCKNNMIPKSGCSFIKKAIEKGFTDTEGTFDEECK